MNPPKKSPNGTMNVIAEPPPEVRAVGHVLLEAPFMEGAKKTRMIAHQEADTNLMPSKIFEVITGIEPNTR